LNSKKAIKCPHCNKDIDINDALYHQLENDFENEIKEKRKEYKKALVQLKEKEENLNKKIEEKASQQLKEELKKKELELKKNLEKEQGNSISMLKKELDEKSEQVKELNESKILIQKLVREKEEITSSIKAKSELELNQKILLEKEKITQQINEENALKNKESEEKFAQVQAQLKIAQQKINQGSMQLQGEVQELAIEEYLANKYHFDNISEIKKGQKGADCIQIVNTREMQNCGSIYYESKRTKEFSNLWIEKFKSDMREKGSDIGVLVTESLPKDMQKMGLKNNIWICTFEEFKSLSYVLREHIIKIAQIKEHTKNKTDKMSLLYSFLTSNEFKMQIEAIVEGFTQMQMDLNTEKRSMNMLWNKREKQIEKVLQSTTKMYGSIKGIAGNSIEDIKSLSLGYDDIKKDNT